MPADAVRNSEIPLRLPPALDGEPALDARLRPPSTAAAPMVVLCHPHPLYGGTMDNKVITTLARRLGEAGFGTLRFDFRGAGRSEGTHDGSGREALDVIAALVAAASETTGAIWLAGYSFGSWNAARALALPHLGGTPRLPQIARPAIARVRHLVLVGPPLSWYPLDELAHTSVPLTIVLGDRDAFCSVDRMAALVDGERSRGRDVEGLILPECDHLFTRRLFALWPLVEARLVGPHAARR